MIRYQCDNCGAALQANDHQRFIVKLEAFAAAGPVELTPEDLARDRSDEINQVIDQLNDADPDEIEDQTYRVLKFDLCGSCHRTLLSDPLGGLIRDGRRRDAKPSP